MDWIVGNSLYKSSPYTRQQQQSTMHAVSIYNTQYRISYSKGNNSQWITFLRYLFYPRRIKIVHKFYPPDIIIARTDPGFQGRGTHLKSWIRPCYDNKNLG
jgi:hypothetical protein